METIITRDSDIIREYIGVLDARERSLSPFARLAATTKLSQLRDEIERNHLDITDDDLTGLRREIDHRLGRSFVRRFEAKRWGARVSAFLMVVLGSQLALALVLAATALFVRFVPLPGWWNKQLPHDEPAFLVAFVFVLFFTTPWLALLLVSGGRYFRAWRVTIPATIAIMLISGLGAYLVVRGKRNPILSQSSQVQFARERGVRSQSYTQWVDSKWLLRDPKFQADYEKFLRNGPGRWITSRFEAKDDAAWHNSLRVMGEYLDGGEDPNAIRDWLKYYLDKNRIYSEDRIEQEVGALTGPEDQRYLGIWEVEPFLKERDERLYRSYLGSINRAIKGWVLLEMGVMALAFLAAYVIWPRLGSLSPQSLVSRVREGRAGGGEPATGASVRLTERRYRFPEQGDITTPPFFDTPFLILGRVHRSFLSLAVGTSLIVFLFWAAVYGLRLGGNQNVASQIALMRSYIAFGSGGDAAGDQVQENTLAETAIAPGSIVPAGTRPEGPLAFLSVFGSGIGSGAIPSGGRADQVQLLIARLNEIQQRLDDSEYENSKKLKDQGKLITAQAAELGTLKGRLDQLQQTTMPLTQQVPDLSTRIGAVEDRAGQTTGDISAVKQQVDTLDKNLTTKLQEVEARATRASDQAGRVEEKASTLGTRTDALEKELDRRSRQLEARTEELGTRTTDLGDKQEKLDRLEAVSLDAVLSAMAAETDDLDRKTKSAFYRFFNKAEARHNTEALAQRIKQFAEQLRQSQSKQTESYLTRLDGLTSRVEQIARRLK
jgi:predicted  nucleic acid-binding Zn-ribbon protein